jgi:hypothetical protein
MFPRASLKEPTTNSTQKKKKKKKKKKKSKEKKKNRKKKKKGKILSFRTCTAIQFYTDFNFRTAHLRRCSACLKRKLMLQNESSNVSAHNTVVHGLIPPNKKKELLGLYQGSMWNRKCAFHSWYRAELNANKANICVEILSFYKNRISSFLWTICGNKQGDHGSYIKLYKVLTVFCSFVWCTAKKKMKRI